MLRQHYVWHTATYHGGGRAECVTDPSEVAVSAVRGRSRLQEAAADSYYPCKECGPVIGMADLSDSGIADRLPKRPCASFCTPAVK